MLLKEITGVVDAQAAIEVVENIKKNCQPFIKEWGGVPHPDQALYRGIDIVWPHYIFNTQPKRKPMGMNLKAQSELDDFFQQEYGHKYRSEYVVFCTGNEAHTQMFGEPHVIFPVGNFSYLWSPDINDINFSFILKMVHEVIDESRFIHNRLLSDVADHEVMINVKSYYAIPIKVYKRSIYPLLIK